MHAKTTFVPGYNQPWIESPFGKPLSVNCERVLACLSFGAKKAAGLRQSIPELEQYAISLACGRLVRLKMVSRDRQLEYSITDFGKYYLRVQHEIKAQESCAREA